MSLGHGSSITRNGLAVHFDLDNAKSWKGKPTTNLLNNPRMLPSDPYSSYANIGSAYVSYNIGGSGWGFVRYPNSNLSVDGGVEWLPQEQGPLSNKGVWKMRVRPGGNSETQIYRSIGSVDNTQPIIISVYMKCNISGMGRIHLNVTQNGASSWGFASSYHSGNGQWERLSLTIPANSGVSSINTVRAQCIGTTRTDDVLISNFQAEYGTFATQFVEGQRLDTASIIDISKRNTITPYNLTYQQGVGPQFDGVDGLLHINGNNVSASPSAHSIEMWCNVNTGGGIYSSYNGDTNRVRLSTNGSSFSVFSGHSSNGPLSFNTPNVMLSGQWNHIVVTLDYNNNDHKIYVNGQLEATSNTDLNPPNAFGHVTVGCHLDYDVPAPSYYNFYDGEVGQFRLYDGILTQDNITNNFEASRGRYGINV